MIDSFPPTGCDPACMQTAAQLSMQGRLLEAAEAIEAALREEVDPAHREQLTIDLIEMLERMGDAPRLAMLLATITPDQPAALARAGLAWLSLGELATAASQMVDLIADAEHGPAALRVLIVAAALTHRPHLASAALSRLLAADAGPKPEAMAEAWRRGLFGRLLLDQRSARSAGCDPVGSALDAIIRQALDVFDEDLHAAAEADDSQVEPFASACRAALIGEASPTATTRLDVDQEAELAA